MTYNDLFFQNSLLSAIPLADIKDGEMSEKALTDIILMQVQFQRLIQDFQDFMQNVTAKLKKDGFDDRLRKYVEYESLSKKKESSELTDEEESAYKSGKIEAETFKQEYDALDSAVKLAFRDKSNENIPDTRKLSADTYREIIRLIGVNGNITITSVDGQKIDNPKVDFLKMLGVYVVSDAV